MSETANDKKNWPVVCQECDAETKVYKEPVTKVYLVPLCKSCIQRLTSKALKQGYREGYGKGKAETEVRALEEIGLLKDEIRTLESELSKYQELDELSEELEKGPDKEEDIPVAHPDALPTMPEEAEITDEEESEEQIQEDAEGKTLPTP